MHSSEISPETGQLRVSGFDLPYQWWGNKYDLPVIFFHEFGRNTGDFASVCAALVHKGYSCLSLSLPLHHQPNNEPELFNTSGFSRNLTETLAHNGFSEYILAAHAFGTRLALPVASARPEVLKKLILIAPEGFSTRDDQWFRVAKFPMVMNLLDHSDWLANFYAELYKPGLSRIKGGNIAGLFRSYLRMYPEIDLYHNGTMGKLYTIDCPVELIWGEQDNEIPFHLAAEVKQHFRYPHIHPLKDCGHNPMIENPELLIRTITKILC